LLVILKLLLILVLQSGGGRQWEVIVNSTQHTGISERGGKDAGGGEGWGLVSRITPYTVQLFIVFFFSSPCLLKQEKILEEEN
jgi:hypothetical protein